MAALRYTRVKDRITGHEYDVLSHKFDADKHTRVNKAHFPEVSRPRPAKPNVKGKRSTSRSSDAVSNPGSGDPS